MTTCRDVIQRAFRKIKIYSPGETVSADDAADGLEELQSLYESWGSNGMFGRLSDRIETADYEAEPFQRITISGGTVTLPTSLVEDDTLPPYALSFIEVIDTDAETVTRYLYENGAWVEIGALSLDDEAPLANRGPAGLAACLAINLAEEYGGEIGPMTARQAGSFKTGLSLKLGSDAPRTGPDYY
jgi:hypothetical protein